MANVFRCDKCKQYAGGSVTITFISKDDYEHSDICLDLCDECLNLFRNLAKPAPKV